MAPKQSHESSYIKLKRHHSITFLVLESPATAETIKQELVNALKDCPGYLTVLNSDEKVPESSLTPENIDLGVEQINVKDNKSATKYTAVSEESAITEKLILWKLKNEEHFEIDDYPENEDEE